MAGWLWIGAWAFAGPVQLTASDGAALAGTTWGEGPRGVLLVHDEARSQADFGMLGAKLGRAGYHVLAIDLRGHGASKAPPPANDDWTPLVADIHGAVRWLTTRGATEIHVVGVRLGANLALNAASTDTSISDLALLGPTLNAHGVKISGAAAALAGRPTLLAAASSDPLSVRAARMLEDSCAGAGRLLLLDRVSSARMLAESTELENHLLVWLSGADRTEVTRADLPSKAGELRTGVRDIQTTGVRIDEK